MDASGVLIATQVASGQENNLKIKVYGEKGGLEWRQEEPNS
jgi:predicted dehydrogenase